MSSINKSACALAVFAVAALAGPAFAGKPMNVVEKRAAAEAKAQQVQAANADVQVSTDGSPAATVPDELHNYMQVQRDSKGNLRVVETDGKTAPSKAVEVTDE